MFQTGIAYRYITRIYNPYRSIRVGETIQAGCGVNLERGTYNKDYVCLRDKVYGRLHLRDRLAEKHYMGPVLRSVGGFISQRDALISAVYYVFFAEAVEFVAGIFGTDLGYFAVEMDYMGAAGAFVEIVDILSNHIYGKALLELGYQPVGFIGLYLAKVFALHIVKVQHERGISRPTLG